MLKHILGFLLLFIVLQQAQADPLRFLLEAYQKEPQIFKNQTVYDADILERAAYRLDARVGVPFSSAQPPLLEIKLSLPEHYPGTFENSSALKKQVLKKWGEKLLNTWMATPPQKLYDAFWGSARLTKADQDLIVLKVLFRHYKVDRLKTRRNLLHNLTEADLDILREAESPYHDILLEQVAELERQFVGGVDATPVEEQEQNPSGVLTLREVHPDVALFRGFIGNDCSTLYSFAYALSPQEKTYFIYNGYGRALGYVSTTRILLEGKPALYLHTINGEGISQLATTVILKVFDQIKHQLGIEQIVLPISQRVGENMNYHSIKEAYWVHTHEKPWKKIQYLDHEVRKNLQTSHAHYDRPDANEFGIEYVQQENDQRIPVEVQTQLKDPKNSALEAKPKDFYQMFLDLENSGRVSLVSEIFKTYGTRYKLKKSDYLKFKKRESRSCQEMLTK